MLTSTGVKLTCLTFLSKVAHMHDPASRPRRQMQSQYARAQQLAGVLSVVAPCSRKDGGGAKIIFLWTLNELNVES